MLGAAVTSTGVVVSQSGMVVVVSSGTGSVVTSSSAGVVSMSNRVFITIQVFTIQKSINKKISGIL